MNSFFREKNGNESCFILIRHGATPYNEEFRLQGRLNIPLSETGVRQAEELASRLKDCVFSTILTSDLIRARQTAEIVLKRVNTSRIVVSPYLREASFGPFEGKTYSEISKETGIPVKDIIERGLDSLNGVEKREDLYTRVTGYLERFVSSRSTGNGGRILVITHGGVIRILASKLLHRDFSMLHFRNGEGIVLLHTKSGWLGRIIGESEICEECDLLFRSSRDR